MTSDVENLTTFYANLPSIFEIDPSTSIEPSSNTNITIIDNNKTYQPIFGSFLFADSEPFMRAAFVASTSSSIEVKPTEEEEQEEQEEQKDEAFDLKENNIETIGSSPLAPVEDISDIDNNDDEDDFDGIPIRHASSMIKEKLNNDNHSEHNNLLEKIVHSIENDDDDDVEELFLNGFTDQQHDKPTIPSLFNNIPDIDDLNEYDEEEDDDDRIPFDHMDMLDQSDSIRSSSPDSVLSSSHLRDDDDDDDDDDMNNNDDDEDDVTQWNDDYLLGKITLQNDRPNAPLPPPIFLNIHPHDQVDFIDSSRSNSRCSNASSHLSIGYTDQARIFINDDDGLVALSDSDSDHDDGDDKIDFENDLLTRDNSEEPCLQVNLDYHRSRSPSHSSYSQSNSPYSSSSSPIPDQSPIVAIDEDINEIKNNIQSAPIAIVDDDDNDDDIQAFTSDQPVLSPLPLKNLIEFRNENRQNEIVRDIVNLRHILNDHDNDDEFIAIMHNPTVFEEVLYDNDDRQKSDLVKQTNAVTNIFQSSSLLLIDNKMKSEPFEHYQNIQEKSLLSVSNNEKNSPSNITTTNNSSPTAVNHLPLEIEKEEEENADAVNHPRIKLKKTQQSQDKNITNINIEQIANSEQEQQDHYQMISSDDESDNDSELLETLSQLHGLVHTPRLSSEINETEILKTQIQQFNEEKTNNLISNFNNNEKQNIIFFNNDDKNQKQNSERNEEKKSLTSSVLFNDDESHSTDMILNSNASSSLIISNNSMLSPFDIEILSIVEKLVSNTLQLALNEINESNQQIEQLVEEILSEIINEICNKDENFTTENLELIINWHNQTNKQLFDPFDQKFHNIWINHFQTPDDLINENNIDTTIFHSNINSSLLINPFDTFILFTNESSIKPDEQINNESKDFSSTENLDDIQLSPTIEVNENDNNQSNKHNSFFENQQRLSQFESFASDHPLHSAGLESITAEIDNQFDESTQIQKSTTDDNNEPWELEDNSEEKLKPIPTIITQKYDSYNNTLLKPPLTEESSDEENNENENYDKYFTNYQTNENIEIPSTKTVRFNDNIQNVNVITPKDSINLSESSTTTTSSDSDETDDEHIKPNLQTTNDHIDEKETSDHETNGVVIRDIVPRPESDISLTESEDLPPELPRLPPLNKPTIANDNIPTKSSPSSSNIDLKRKINLRSQSKTTPTIQTATDTRIYGNVDSQFNRSNDSGIVIFIFI